MLKPKIKADKMLIHRYAAAIVGIVMLSHPIVQFYIDLLMRSHKQHPDKGYDALALQVSERARARSLVELLNEAAPYYWAAFTLQGEWK